MKKELTEEEKLAKKEAKRLYFREYRIKNLEKKKKQQKEWKAANKEKVRESARSYYHKHKYKYKLNQQKWKKNNQERVRERDRKYEKNRKDNDILFKLKKDLQRTACMVLKNGGYTKKTRTHEILGCSYEQFKTHLEAKFEPWMNWDNRGNWGGIPSKIDTAWDIDHIIPLSSAKNEEELLKLCHYTNLQPLCSYTNRHIKRNKIQN